MGDGEVLKGRRWSCWLVYKCHCCSGGVDVEVGVSVFPYEGIQ